MRRCADDAHVVFKRGRFIWHHVASGTVARTSGQLSMLLEGIDWRRPVRCGIHRRRCNSTYSQLICTESVHRITSRMTAEPRQAIACSQAFFGETRQIDRLELWAPGAQLTMRRRSLRFQRLSWMPSPWRGSTPAIQVQPTSRDGRRELLQIAHKSPSRSKPKTNRRALRGGSDIKGRSPQKRREIYNPRSWPLLESLKRWLERPWLSSRENWIRPAVR